MNEYLRCNIGLIDSCRESAMRCFDEVSRVDMEESTWCPLTLEVNNKWLNKGGNYHDNAARQFKELGMDIDECLDGLFIEGIGEVEKLEKEEMVTEVMAVEGVTPNEENKTTWLDEASMCTGVTTGSTAGTVAKAMATMNAGEIVLEEKKKQAAAQQAALTLQVQVEELKHMQLQIFMSNLDNNGLSSVTTTSPVAIGDLGHHAWKTMSAVLDKQDNQFLKMVSEQLVGVPEERLRAKKDRAYLAALAKVGMRKRCEAFLSEWEKDGPKCVGLPGKHRHSLIQEGANKHLAPLITDSVKGSRLHCIMRDLQSIDKEKLLHMKQGVYLAVLQEVGASGLVQ